MSTVQRFSDIVSEPTRRYKSGFVFLDLAYGRSEIDGIEEYGLPHGKISIWGGEGGVGKTRLSTDIALMANAVGHTVLYIQNEVSPSEFKGWVKRTVRNPGRFYVSDHTRLDEQIEAIRSTSPDIVVVDSVNMLEGFKNPTQLRKIMDEYKETTSSLGCHVIFISHLNGDGELKGNKDLGYLGDTICHLEKLTSKMTKAEIQANTDVSINSKFTLTIGKNRYGSSGGHVVFQHVAEGINYHDSSEELLLREGQRDYKFVENDLGHLDYVPKCMQPKGVSDIIIPKSSLGNVMKTTVSQPASTCDHLSPTIKAHLAKLVGKTVSEYEETVRETAGEMRRINGETQGVTEAPEPITQGVKKTPGKSSYDGLLGFFLGRD